MTTARSVALDCLLACEKQGAWSDGYLKQAVGRAGLDRRDAGLCVRLAYGVLQNRMLLDWHLDRLSTISTEKMEPAVRASLRLGLYQLLFLDRVPAHAAVSESVALIKARSHNPRSAGLVNAVLRTADREKDHMPQPQDLSVRYSHPEWLVKEFSHTLSKSEVESLLAANNGQPPTCVQVNTCRSDKELVDAALQAEGVEAKEHPWLPNCLLLEGTGDLSGLKAFRDGWFYVQDAAARLAVLAADPRPGMRVLDACAAPGGKSFAAALAMNCKGSVLSCDIHPNKVKLIREGAQRLGLNNITAEVRDGKTFDPALEGQFDLVMADVPCSGLGIIRKKPEIRYKDPKPLEGLPQVQRDILENVSRYVKPGGTLLYATCTLLRRENEDVVNWFIDKEKDFALEPFHIPGPVGESRGMVTLWPHIHGTDGFFFAKLRRR